jgi:predicted dehydrogenase
VDPNVDPDMTEPFLDLDYKPKLPSKRDYGIGLVGAGQIANQAHLPAYRKAGFRVLAVTDADPSAAAKTAAAFGIPRVCENLDELLDVPGIEIVDFAVPARHNPELAIRALRRGKHVLVQKPMAESVSEAESMVKEAHANGCKLAVNHQMRWAPSVRAAASLLKKRFFGELLECTFQIHIRTAWDSWPWLQSLAYPEIYYHSIHHVDSLRSLLGDPVGLYATLARHPGSKCVGPTRNYILFEYPGDLRACFIINHHTSAPADDFEARLTIEGTEGCCEGLLGLLLNYPTGRSDVLTVSNSELTPRGSLRLELEGRWFPDAFIGPMASLMEAITHDRDPETSGEQGLATLRLAEAICRSHETRSAIAFR